MAQLDKSNPFVRNINSQYFVGREAELSRFQRNLAGLRQANPNHEYVAGLEAGGKTSYLHKVAELARVEKMVACVVAIDQNHTPHLQITTIISAIIDAMYQQLQAARPQAPVTRELRADWDAGAAARLFRHPRLTELIASELRQDFQLLHQHVKEYGYDGIVACLDEGQWLNPLTLSGLKNAVETIGTVQLVMAWRLSTDTGGAEAAARREIRDKAAAAGGDQGAARLFGTATAVGPFATDAEVRRFFETRLANKPVQFAEPVCLRLGEIADKVPGRMIELPSRVYDRAIEDQIDSAPVRLLDECFRKRYVEELKQAVDLCADMPNDMLDILKALCDFPEGGTALDLISRAFPGLQDPVIRAGYAEGKASRLEELCKRSVVLFKDGDKFAVANNVYRYAMKIAMNVT